MAKGVKKLKLAEEYAQKIADVAPPVSRAIAKKAFETGVAMARQEYGVTPEQCRAGLALAKRTLGSADRCYCGWPLQALCSICLAGDALGLAPKEYRYTVPKDS